MNKNRVAVASIIMVILFGLPFGFKSQYFMTVGIFVFIYSILSLGLRAMMKVGEVSFAHAAFMGIGAYTSALLTMKLQLSFWVAWSLASLVAGIVALFLGSLAVRTKGVHFFIVTLAMGETVRLIAMNWNARLLGGPNGIYGIPPPSPIDVGFLTMRFDSRMGMYMVALVALLVVVGILWRVDRSRIGRIWDVIGQDEKLAAVIGINVYRHKLASFILSSTVAGLGGVIFAHTMTYISPYDFSFFVAVQLLMYVIFGGSNTLAGPIVGAASLVVLSEFLRKVGHYELIFYGLILIIVLRFIPEGVVGYLIKKRLLFARSGKR
jgi:branched-chain amino acid transport system permease protein